MDKKKDDLYALPRLMYEGPPLNSQIKYQSSPHKPIIITKQTYVPE